MSLPSRFPSYVKIDLRKKSQNLQYLLRVGDAVGTLMLMPSTKFRNVVRLGLFYGPQCWDNQKRVEGTEAREYELGPLVGSD